MAVQTVTGNKNAEELGKVLMHEHFYFGYPGFQGDITLGGFEKETALDHGISSEKNGRLRGEHRNRPYPKRMWEKPRVFEKNL